MTEELSGFIRGAMSAAYEDDGEPEVVDTIDLRPPDIAEAAWARLTDEQREGILAARAGEDSDDDEELEEAVPLAGNELKEAVHETVVGLLDDRQNGAWRAAGYDPEEVVISMTTMSAAEWAAYCEDTGWDPTIRPSYSDLPRELQVRHHREVLERRMAELTATGKHLESGTSR